LSTHDHDLARDQARRKIVPIPNPATIGRRISHSIPSMKKSLAGVLEVRSKSGSKKKGVAEPSFTEDSHYGQNGSLRAHQKKIPNIRWDMFLS
jgi:hypothetical protein